MLWVVFEWVPALIVRIAVEDEFISLFAEFPSIYMRGNIMLHFAFFPYFLLMHIISWNVDAATRIAAIIDLYSSAVSY